MCKSQRTECQNCATTKVNGWHEWYSEFDWWNKGAAVTKYHKEQEGIKEKNKIH